MYQKLYEIITDRLRELSFTNIGSALQTPPPLPSVQVFLMEDKELDSSPAVRRQVSYGVQLTVGPGSDGDTNPATLHQLLAALMDGFAGLSLHERWIIEPVSVPKLTITDHVDHKGTQYLILLVFILVPKIFEQKTRELP